MAVIVIGLIAALPASAAKAAYPRSYNPETAAGFTNTFSTNETLSPACPEAIAATPGSDPASKVLNGALNTTASTQAGGTVHFIYNDNPHPNGGTQNFTIQDCVVTYPSGFFTASDFDPTTGVLTNAAYSKSRLTKGGTQIDGASLSGINQSQGNIYYSWTAPSTLAVDSWVCFFARDIKNNHGGGGNRKVPPTCYQVMPRDVTPPPLPGIFLGYADTLHNVPTPVQRTPSPWLGSSGVTFLGCVVPSAECGDEWDGGAIRLDNVSATRTMTLTDAYVDINYGITGTCHYAPWDSSLLPATAAPGGTLILTQSGTLGPAQPAPCDSTVAVADRPFTNFDSSEGPTTACGTTAVPVITLVVKDGTTQQVTTLTVTDSAQVLNTGGSDSYRCRGLDEFKDWTVVPQADIVRTP